MDTKNFIKKTFFWFDEKLRRDNLDAFAAQSAFFIMISIIPFSVILLSLLSLTDINGETLLQYVLSLLPKDISKLLSNIILVEFETVAILSIAGFAALWSASKAVIAILKGLYSVFGIEEKRNYFHIRALSILYTLAFAIILVATAVILVFGNSIYDFTLREFAPNFTSTVLDNKYIWSFLILSIFFTSSYKLVSRKINLALKFALIGGICSSLGWMLFSLFFSIFVENFANYSNMYGSLAAVVIFMLWLYFCMYIMLFSAEICVWLNYKCSKSKVKLLTKK